MSPFSTIAATSIVGNAAGNLARTTIKHLATPANSFLEMVSGGSPTASDETGKSEDLTSGLIRRIAEIFSAAGVSATSSIRLDLSVLGGLYLEGDLPNVAEIENLLAADTNLISLLGQWSRETGQTSLDIDPSQLDDPTAGTYQ
jgi:hypothetical protein